MPLIGSPVKSIPLMRKTGEAGMLEDRSIADFMKHLDVLECQRSSKQQNMAFRENYRKKSLQPGVSKTYQQKNFILPA